MLLEALIALVITSLCHPANSIEQQKVVTAARADPELFWGDAE